MQNEYVITNGKQFANNGSASTLVSSLSEAFKWKTRESAENVLDEAHKRRRMPLDGSYHVSEVIHYVAELNPDLDASIFEMQSFVSVYKQYAGESQSLQKQLSKVDRKLSDLEHYIEMQNVSSSKGYKLYKKMQELRRERRQIKKAITLVKALSSISEESIAELEKALRYINADCYMPKELDFDDILGDNKHD